MLAAYAEKFGLPDPIDGFVVGDRPDPVAPPGWEVVEVRAASLNRHDLWTLQGQSPVPFEPPVILGCDAAGVTADGREVVVHALIQDGESFRMLSDGIDGTFAARVAVPSANLVPKPAAIGWEEAACLPTAWLTAYSMLFTKAGLRPGERVLVQGASGGVSTAAIALAAAAGAEVVVTSRSDDALARAREIGASETVPQGGRLSERVDVVIETVGAATRAHSLRAVRPGGRIAVSGATTGGDVSADLQRVMWRELQILGVRMGTIEDLHRLCAFVASAGIHPAISRVYDGVSEAPAAMRELDAGGFFGKLVIRIS